MMIIFSSADHVAEVGPVYTCGLYLINLEKSISDNDICFAHLMWHRYEIKKNFHQNTIKHSESVLMQFLQNAEKIEKVMKLIKAVLLNFILVL